MITSKRKSEALTRDEFSSLKKFAKNFRTVVECAEAIGISREVLDRLLVVGSGSPATISKVRSALSLKQ
jgi:DNA-binding phage protein